MTTEGSAAKPISSEAISSEALTRMERDGWTPAEVRALIASYRELARRATAGRPFELSSRSLSALCHLRAACDTSSATAVVSVQELSALLVEITEDVSHD